MFRYAFILYTLFLFAVPITAHAQETPGDPPATLGSYSITTPASGGGRLMDEGEAAYSAGDYEAALGLFKKALPLLMTDADRAKAHERLAFIYAAFDKTEMVYSEFIESLKLDSGLTLDPDLVSPKIYESYKKAKDVVVREGSLICNCDPSGAEVYLDGKLLGEAPVKKERIPEGEYALMLKKYGYETATGRITIKKDVTLTVEDRLATARGEIKVDTEPPGVRVSLDGRDAGITPVTVEKVSGGEHVLKLERDYYEPDVRKVSLTQGGEGSVAAVLKRRLLLIPVSDGGEMMKAVEAAFSEMDVLKVVVSGMDELAEGLKERGLDPGALGFLKRSRTNLALEDSATLSGLMERARVELAMAVSLSQPDGGIVLTLTLYSPASDSADRIRLTAKDAAGLKDALGTFLDKWKAQERSARLGTGAYMVDRAGGGVEVTGVLPNSPAFDAGLAPGNLINTLDGAVVTTKADLAPLTRVAGKHNLGFMERGRQKETVLSPAYLPVEAPPDSPDYLYNLDLVDCRWVFEAVAPDEVNDRRGLSALNLGNAYLRMGEYDKAIKAYTQASTKSDSGVCYGTALYRLGAAYERKSMWAEAAYAYRKAMVLYPAATLGSADGPYVAPLAKGRMVSLYEMGLVRERWWE